MINQIKARVRRLAQERACDMIERIRNEEETKRNFLTSKCAVSFSFHVVIWVVLAFDKHALDYYDRASAHIASAS